jgi:hypothetical protein
MMKLPLRLSLILLVLSSAGRVAAQELSLLGGTMSTHDGRFSTYSFQLDYRQNVTRYTAGSIAYINEGHIPNHHRDGTAFQAWGRLPLLHDQLALAAGVGGYFFYDTQPVSRVDSADIHGTAPIYSLSATWYLHGRWSLRGQLNRIAPAHGIQTTTAVFGAGYWFGQDRKPTKDKLGDAPALYSYVTENQVTVYGGKSIVNTLFSETGTAWAAEFRRGVIPHVDWTVTGIHEGDPRIVRRNGVATQGWLVNTFYNERVSVGIGLGPYLYIDRRHPEGLTPWSPAAAAALVSLTGSVRLDDHWLVRLLFNRVTTDYNRDSDVLLVGLGYRWGARDR